MLEDLDIAEDDETFAPLPAVSSSIMRIVLEWAALHQNDTTPFVPRNSKDKRDSYSIPKADAEFLEKLDQGIFSLDFSNLLLFRRNRCPFLPRAQTDNERSDIDCVLPLINRNRRTLIDELRS